METANSPAVLLLNLPHSALAGIDLLSFTTTSRFQGIKNLPFGFHLAFVGSSTAFSERHGIWFTIPRGGSDDGSPPLVVTKWDSQSETLIAETTEAEALRWRANLGSIWREGLTPYRQAAPKTNETAGDEESNDWPALTSRISPQLLTRITGGESNNWRISSASSSKRDLEDIPGLSKEDLDLHADKELDFLPIDLKQTWREGATGRERTEAAQDRSWALNALIGADLGGGEEAIISELQFCFLMVLTINNFSCLEQWKRILSLLFTCKTAVAVKPGLFISAIAALRLQLQHCKDAEGGLIDLADEGGSLLKHLLVRFRKGLEGLPKLEVQDVIDELDDLEDYLRQEYGWQFGGSFAKSGVLELEDGEQVRMDTTAFDEDDETGEFAPQVAELTEEQAKMLNIVDAGDLHVSLSRTSLKDKEIQEVESSEDDSESGESGEADDLEDMDARY